MTARALIPSLLLAALAALAVPGEAAAQPTPCVVAFVVDGDTFNCRDGTSVRLIGVDAPEGGRVGTAARRALATLLPVESTVTLQTDQQVRDSNGRLLAYAYLPDGRMVNVILVELGYAFYRLNPPNDRHAAELRAAEDRAKEGKHGVWH